MMRHLRNLGGRVAVCAVSFIAWAFPTMADDMLSGIWVGTYICAQGRTALRLVIEPKGERWSGIFSLSAEKGNPNVPSGSFAVVGTENGGIYTLVPGEWIDQPKGFVSVGLSGELSEDGNAYYGNVDFVDCDRFHVRRVVSSNP